MDQPSNSQVADKPTIDACARNGCVMRFAAAAKNSNGGFKPSLQSRKNCLWKLKAEL